MPHREWRLMNFVSCNFSVLEMQVCQLWSISQNYGDFAQFCLLEKKHVKTLKMASFDMFRMKCFDFLGLKHSSVSKLPFI